MGIFHNNENCILGYPTNGWVFFPIKENPASCIPGHQKRTAGLFAEIIPPYNRGRCLCKQSCSFLRTGKPTYIIF